MAQTNNFWTRWFTCPYATEDRRPTRLLREEGRGGVPHTFNFVGCVGILNTEVLLILCRIYRKVGSYSM